jgi:hypothetical protein
VSGHHPDRACTQLLVGKAGGVGTRREARRGDVREKSLRGYVCEHDGLHANAHVAVSMPIDQLPPRRALQPDRDGAYVAIAMPDRE